MMPCSRAPVIDVYAHVEFCVVPCCSVGHCTALPGSPLSREDLLSLRFSVEFRSLPDANEEVGTDDEEWHDEMTENGMSCR